MANQHKITTPDQILKNASGQLDHIVRHIADLKALDGLLNTLLPAELRPHCKIANFEKGKLSIAVSNGAIASKWHYLKPQLLSQLRRHPTFAGIAHINIAARPEYFAEPQEPEPIEGQKFSEQTRQQLMTLISNTDDKKLKIKLEELLKNCSLPN